MAAATKGQGVTVKDLAEKLGTTPYELRKFIRGLDLGVGRGTRYQWPSMNSADVKRICHEWESAATK
jgi:hypothetical protein